MEIRSARQEDLPGIIDCLKRSLGETSSPKSVEYWKWKHVDNPFGPSPVLIAVDQDKVVGVRAFMRWQWRWQSRNFKALRAVDTATDPDYQGQGIFKKLTMTLLEKCRKEGDDLIFNTPNTQSKPGYLKMGWSEVGKLPVRIKVRKPVAMAMNYLRNETPRVPRVDKSLPIFNLTTALKNFDDSIARYPRPSGIFTPKNKTFLQWRYINCPIQHYYGYVEGEDQQMLCIFYPKPQRFGIELRLCEVRANSPFAMKRMKRAMRLIERTFNPVYWSVANLGDSVMKDALKESGFGRPRQIGPILTLNRLQPQLQEDWLSIQPWDATLGDLELF